MTHIPTPDQVVSVHRPLLRVIVEALRQGTIHAQAYADWMDEAHDRALAPALVRKAARRYFIGQGQAVEDEELDYETEFLSNLGLSITAAGVQIRVLRSATGDQLPVPGQSQRRQDFYQQYGLFDHLVSVAFPDPATVPVRLILHWSTDAEYNLSRVYLACPRAGGVTRDSVQAHWDWPIWRRHDVAVDGQVQAEVSDLDIYLEGDVAAIGNAG